jgi:GGDEF domain-containing protein
MGNQAETSSWQFESNRSLNDSTQELYASASSVRGTVSFGCVSAALRGKDRDMRTAEIRSIMETGMEFGRIMDGQLFLHFLDFEVKRACRYQNFLCILVIKVEHCSKNNEEIDDEMCREIVGNLLKAEMRESDILASFGSNQLVILLPYADKASGNVAKSRLENSLNHYEFKETGYEVKVRKVCFPTDGTSTKDLIERMLAQETN